MTIEYARPTRAWQVAPADHDLVRRLSDATGLSGVTIKVLLARGIRTPEAIDRFLAPDLDREWFEPGVIQ